MRISRTLRVSAAFLSLFLSFSSPSRAAGSSADAAANVSAFAGDIYNFGRISDTYYRGSEPDAQDIAALAAFGVRTIIDLQQDGDEQEPGLVEHAGMKYVRIPMTTRVPPTAAQLAQFLALVNEPANQPVYVHCREGRHRTGVMTAAYRMLRDGWTADQAFREMKDFKFGRDFLHPEFKRFVYGFKPSAVLAAAQTAVTAAATR